MCAPHSRVVFPTNSQQRSADLNLEVSQPRVVLWSALITSESRETCASTSNVPIAVGCQCGSSKCDGLSTQVPYYVPSRCSVAEHKLRVTAFCALRNILRHTGSVTEHRDGTHHSLHDICSVFMWRCTGFGMPCPVLYVFLKYRKFIHFTCSFLAWRCLLGKLVVFVVVSTGTGHLSVCGHTKKQDLFLF